MELFKTLQPMVAVLQPIVIIAAVVFMLYMRSKFVSKEEFAALMREKDALAAKVTQIEGRCDRMNERLTQQPSAKDVHDLNIAITRLTGEIGIANERMSGMEDMHKVFRGQVDRIEEFLAKTR